MRILLLLTASLFVSSCVEDLSHQSPYSRAIGKSFILQQDLYIYSSLGSSGLVIGTPLGLLPYEQGLPPKVDSKHIGFKNNEFVIKGVVVKKSKITLKKIVINWSIEDSSPAYIFSIDSNLNNKGSSISASYQLLQLQKNPPFTTIWRNKNAPPVPIWSDPPIFKAEYALPLPSDGIWWK